MPNREVLLEYRGVEAVFEMGGLKVRALNGIDLDLFNGEVLGILGESGSGKTVLIHATLGVLPDNARIQGHIMYRGLDLLSMREKEARKIFGKNFSLVPQGFGSLNPSLRSWLQIAERPMEHFGLSAMDGHRLAEQLIAQLGVEQYRRVANNYRHELSGGMLQRILVAMGISASSEIAFFDEPTKGLDERKKRLVIKLIQLSRDNSNSMVVVSHDLEFLRHICDRVAVMYCGDLVEVCSKEDFFSSPKHPYSKALIDSMPSMGLKPIGGALPSMASPPPGCKFHPRCQYVSERCRVERPQLHLFGTFKVRCHLYDRKK